MNSPLIDAGGLLILPQVQVQNANAISGPLTWGFPSPTAFTGFTHALERRLAGGLQQGLGGVGIICHRFEPQIAQPARRRTQVFCLTRNPVGKDGAPMALVEEGRAHMEISLVIAVKDEFGEFDGQNWARAAYDAAQGMRLAGGSLLPVRKGERYEARWQVLPDFLDGQKALFGKLRRRLLPGFALVQREDLLAERLAEIRVHNPDATVLDALLDLTRLNFSPVTVATAEGEDADEEGAMPNKPTLDAPVGNSGARVERQVERRPGWLVPLPIGYAGISSLYTPGEVANARDATTPFRFVESLYSLGQWISPHRLASLEQLLWYSTAEPDAGLYRCINRYANTVSKTEPNSL